MATKFFAVLMGIMWRNTLFTKALSGGNLTIIWGNVQGPGSQAPNEVNGQGTPITYTPGCEWIAHDDGQDCNSVARACRQSNPHGPYGPCSHQCPCPSSEQGTPITYTPGCEWIAHD